jgi:hypothetical protein
LQGSHERIVIQKNEVVTDKLRQPQKQLDDFYTSFAYASTYQYDKRMRRLPRRGADHQL